MNEQVITKYKEYTSAFNEFVNSNTIAEKRLVYEAMLRRSKRYKQNYKLTENYYYLKQSEKLKTHGFRYRHCSYQYIQLKCNGCSQVYKGPARCESRICPQCARKYASKVFNKQKLVSYQLRKTKTKRLMFLTLTLNTDSSKELHKSLFKRANVCTRKLINKLYPRKDGCGGFSVVEVGKKNNIHIHALVYGTFYSQREISTLWENITKDSFVVFIKAVWSPKKCLWYLLKYINKPPEFGSPEKMAEYIDALMGVRRIHTYGVFYNFKFLKNRNFYCYFCGASLGFLGLNGGMGLAPNSMTFEKAREIARIGDN